MKPTPADTTREQEIAWIRAAREGDRDAYCSLVGPHLATLRARVRRAVNRLPHVDADEIVQETLLRSFTSLGQFDEQYTFAQYLFGIARYATLRGARERRREVAVAWSNGTSPVEGETVLPSDGEIPDRFRSLSGADRFKQPDARVRSRHRFLALLSVFLTHGGYPHQQVAFGYSVLLWGRPKRPARSRVGAGAAPRQRADKVQVTGDPERVVREIGGRPLGESGREFRDEMTERESLDPSQAANVFETFEWRLSLRAAELFRHDATSLAIFASSSQTVVGATRLVDYFGRDPRRSVAEWARAVKERVRRHVSGRADRLRVSLPLPESAPRNFDAPGQERPWNETEG